MEFLLFYAILLTVDLLVAGLFVQLGCKLVSVKPPGFLKGIGVAMLSWIVAPLVGGIIGLVLGSTIGMVFGDTIGPRGSGPSVAGYTSLVLALPLALACAAVPYCVYFEDVSYRRALVIEVVQVIGVVFFSVLLFLVLGTFLLVMPA